MTPRSIRRAAERKARKQQQKALKDQLALSPAEPPHTAEAKPKIISAPLLSPARLAANRANARLSTGPTSDPGKAAACRNALKTGLTGRTVLLPSDDAAAYAQHVLAYVDELRPLTQIESDLVQSIADTAWRLKRIPALEMALYAFGRTEFADAFPEHDPAARPALLELKTYLAYEKQLRNLQLQEARLRRRYEKETAELRALQAERANRTAEPSHDSPVGFEFSTTDFDHDFPAATSPLPEELAAEIPDQPGAQAA